MSDVELLFLVLGLIYAWECLVWTPAGATVFVSWFETSWRPSAPLLTNQRGGFVLAPFLPPLGSVWICRPDPVRLTTEGIARLDCRRATSALSTLRFEEIRTLEAQGKKLVIDGKVFAKAGSVTLAAATVARIRELTKLKSSERERCLQRDLETSFDLKSIQERWTDFSGRTLNLRRLTNALFVYLFVAAPLLIWRFGFALSWAPLLAGLYSLTFSIAFLFRRLHTRFYPDAKDERFTHVLILMFSPATTIRARDVLCRPLFESFQPLAIAKALCSESDFKILARDSLLEVAFGTKSRSLLQDERQPKALTDFLKRQGIKAADALRAPTRSDSSCQTYCPRCLSQFTLVEGRCVDCGGLQLIPFVAVKPGTATKS